MIRQGNVCQRNEFNSPDGLLTAKGLACGSRGLRFIPIAVSRVKRRPTERRQARHLRKPDPEYAAPPELGNALGSLLQRCRAYGATRLPSLVDIGVKNSRCSQSADCLNKSGGDARVARRAARESDGLDEPRTRGSPLGIGQPRAKFRDTFGVVIMARYARCKQLWTASSKIIIFNLPINTVATALLP